VNTEATAEPASGEYGAPAFSRSSWAQRAAASRVQKPLVQARVGGDRHEERRQRRRRGVRVGTVLVGVGRLHGVAHHLRAGVDGQRLKIVVVQVERGAPDSRAPDDGGDAHLLQ
jgi:hypothetical protein